MLKTPGLEVTVKGQYYCNVERGKTLKIYKNEIFYLPETMVIQTGYENYIKMIDGRRVKRARPKKEKVSTRVWIQHIIMRLCVPPRLKDKYEDYAGLRTCVIENIKHVTQIPQDDMAALDATMVKSMSLSELQRFLMMEGLTVPIDDFPDIDDARQAVADEYDNVRKAEDKSEAAHTTEKLDTRSDPEAGEAQPTEQKVGEDGVKEDHYMDPSLKPEPAPGSEAANDLLS